MFVFSPGQQAVVPVWGRKDDYFPVHRIYCVGRNYRAHDLEMGGTGRSLPCFFMTPFFRLPTTTSPRSRIPR